MSIATRLREVRDKRGLSQQEMADRLHIKRTAYLRYERLNENVIEPSTSRLIEIARILNTTVAYLVGKTDNDTRITMEDLTEDEIELLLAWRSGDTQHLQRLLQKQIRKRRPK